jgi:adenylate cyclase
MAVEIERKFLVHADRLGELTDGQEIRQGFIPTQGLTAVRVRIAGEQAWLTIKGENRGAARLEFEYAIPLRDARHMLDELCDDQVIHKHRYLRKHAGLTWEIDVFEGQNSGLILAEVELEQEHQALDLPPWIAEEVTGDPRYYNVNLTSRPFAAWS